VIDLSGPFLWVFISPGPLSEGEGVFHELFLRHCGRKEGTCANTSDYNGIPWNLGLLTSK
jgi:hypothetical protein